MQADNVPTVGEGNGYGAVDLDQKEQVRETGCMKGKSFKIFLGVVLLGVTAAAIAMLAIFHKNEDPEWPQFQEYQVRFKKNYANDDEVQERFKAFKASLLEIRRLRSLGGTATFGLNEFTDLTPQEFADEYLGLHTDLTAVPTLKSGVKAASANPVLGDSPTVTTLNWTANGMVTPVRNQGSCGSCWAFACVQTIESAYIRGGNVDSGDVEDFALSVQQMVSCDSSNWGCMGGWPIDAMTYVQTEGGLALEEDYPYKGYTGSCKNNNLNDLVEGTAPQTVGYASQCSSYNNCNNMDEDSMAASLETYGPMVVCVNASPWQYYTGGVMSESTCNSGYGNGRSVLNHAVIVTGFDLDSSTKYWSLKNSWSTSWGDNGYIHLEFGENTCGVANDVLYVEL